MDREKMAKIPLCQVDAWFLADISIAYFVHGAVSDGPTINRRRPMFIGYYSVR